MSTRVSFPANPIPVVKKPGDSAIGGSVNLAGAFVLRATRVGADSFLADVIRMVETAQGARLPIQDLADRVTARFVPVVLIARRWRPSRSGSLSAALPLCRWLWSARSMCSSSPVPAPWASPRPPRW